jgi:hypothetical protein
MKQKHIFEDALFRAKGQSKWVAFIDLDEFILPMKGKTLPEFLSNYKDFGAVAVNWLMFGTSHVKHLKKDQLMIEQLVWRANKNYKYNFRVKSIVQVDCIDMNARVRSVHFFFNMLDDYATVDPNKNILKNGWQSRVLTDKIRIHHYFSRDENFLNNVKLKRPNICDGKRRMLAGCVAASEAVEDRSILIYAEDLRKAVFGKKSNFSDKNLKN